MIKKLYIASFVFFILSSCQNSNTEKADDLQKSLCDQINEDSPVILKGTLNINSNDTIVFENIDKRNKWQRKIHLIPCSNNLKNYIFKSYDSYLYLKNFDDKFWVRVDGKFLTTDTIKSTQVFLFNFVALIDELEALTDSSQAMREIVKESQNITKNNK
jgi:hypothetical protein